MKTLGNPLHNKVKKLIPIFVIEMDCLDDVYSLNMSIIQKRLVTRVHVAYMSLLWFTRLRLTLGNIWGLSPAYDATYHWLDRSPKHTDRQSKHTAEKVCQ